MFFSNPNIYLLAFSYPFHRVNVSFSCADDVNRSIEQKAWAPGSAHPFSQRTATPSQVNGNTMSGKPLAKSTATPDVNSVSQAMTDRQIQVFGTLYVRSPHVVYQEANPCGRGPLWSLR